MAMKDISVVLALLKAVVRFFDTGHFALETRSEDIARAISKFWDAQFVQKRLEHV